MIKNFTRFLILAIPFLGLNLNLFASFNIWASGGTAIDAQETAILSSFTRANPVTSSKSSLFPSWQFSMSITVDNTANPNTLTDYSVLVILNTADLIAQGKMMSSGADIRFTLDDINQLPYWIDPGIQNERGINTDSTHIWVKIPEIPGSSQLTLFMFYGNFSASPVSDIHSTFLFGDDFEDNALDGSKWDVILTNSGQINEQNQRLEHNSPTTAQPYESGSNLLSIAQFTEPIVLEMQFKKGGYVYRNAGLCMDNTVWDNSAAFGWQDYGPLYATTSLSGTPTSVEFNNGITNWSTYNGNPEYYLKIIRKPDGKFSYSMIVPATEPGGPQVWNVDIDLPMPIETPLRVRATEHVWQSASPELRFEDNIRVRKYSYPEPTTKVNKLVAYYPFNGGVMDESGNDNGGITVVNGALLTNDRFGVADKAYAFNGSGDNITLGNSLNLINSISSFTVSAWIKPDSISPVGQHYILCEPQNGNNYQFLIQEGQLNFTLWHNGAMMTFPAGFMSLGKWQHVLVTYNGVEIKFYINGLLNVSYSVLTSIDSNPSTLFVGTYDGYTGFFKGTIDEIRFYNYSLNPDEILQLYANFLPPKTLTAEPGDGQVTLKWSSERINEINHYNIYQDGTGIATVQVTSPMDTVYTISGLINHQAYDFHITSTDHSGNISQPSVHLFKTPSATTVTDIDGNIYSTVTIGTQEWMAENLRTTKYNDGSDIMYVLDNAVWVGLVTPAYCWYNNDKATHKETYGALYNWYTVSMENICPIGWHVPSDAEWYTLENYVDPTINDPNATGYRGIDGGTKLKASYGWAGGVNGTDEYDFMALPAGVRSYQTGSFVNLYYRGYWWSADESDVNYSWIRFLDSEYETIGRNYSVKQYGYPIRCVKDQPLILSLTTSPVTSITPYSATCGGNITDDGGDPIVGRGVVWSIDQDPNILYNYNGFTEDGTGTGEFTSSIVNLSPSTQYYVRAYVINSTDTVYANQQTFTTYNADAISDVDGNYYNVITIGSQEWLAENLRTIHYSNGDPIDNIVDNTDWTNLLSGAYCWYQNDYNSYGATYGALYNWYAVADSRNICPSGWHVPSDAEWYIMENYVDPTINDPIATGYRGIDGGTKLKASYGWEEAYGTDDYGFSALPAGYRFIDSGAFGNLGTYGGWWSASEFDETYAWRRTMRYDLGTVYRSEYSNNYGLSVRCVKDQPPILSLTTSPVTSITPYSATCGGNITDDGGDPIVGRGVVWSIDQDPNILYNYNGYTEDGEGTGEFTSSIVNLTPSIQYYVRAYVINSTDTVYANQQIFTTYNADAISDVDGNYYNVITIGSQEWLAENLRTIHYSNGDPIDNIADNTEWSNLATDAYCWYQNDYNSYGATYGALYNWYAAINTSGVCPAGWRVPSSADFNSLAETLGGSSVAGGKMKTLGYDYWLSPNEGATNESGFNGIGHGYRNTGGEFGLLNEYGEYWTTDEQDASTSWAYFLRYNYQDISSINEWKGSGFAIRCIKNSEVQGVIAHYPFNANANDESGNDFHGTIYGGATLTTDRYYTDNSAWSFNGSDSYVSIPGILPAGSNPLFTVSQWIYIEDYTWGAFFGSGQTVENNKHISLNVSVSGTTRELGVDHWGSQWNTGYIMPVGWHMVTYVSDGSQDIVYVNGQLIGARTIEFTLVEGAETSIGRWNDQAGTFYYFNSKIDEVRLYNYALSVQEVETLFAETNPFAGGTGTEADPWLIATPEQLNLVRQSPEAGRYFRQINDIDLNQWPWNEGEGWEPIGTASEPFKGNYNGEGYSINGVFIVRSGYDYLGLFGYTIEASISNLGVANVDVNGNQMLGGLVGYAYQTTVTNCFTNGYVTASNNYAGGLIGFLESNTTVESCYSTALVSGNNYTGGLVGYNNYSIINNCYATGYVHGTYSGGLVGYANQGSISHSYSTGASETTYGGFICLNSGTTVTSCYWDILSSGNKTSDGGGVGLISGAMTENTSFENWDFNSIWAISEGATYPYLQWQSEPGEHNIANVTQGFEGGAGTESNPWQIATPAQLDNVRNFKDGGYYFMLIADIDLNQSPWNEGEGWMPIGIDSYPFVGHFNGNGYTINGLYINRPETDYQGLFGWINLSTISNLRIENCNITAHDYVGAAAGVLDNSILISSSSTGIISGNSNSGGLIGLAQGPQSSIQNSYSIVNLTGNYMVGGLVGCVVYSQLENCYAAGNCTGYEYVGGLIGYLSEATVVNSYSMGKVVGTGAVYYSGGLIGYASGSNSIQSSYWDTQTSGQLASNGGEGKATGYMLEQGLYAGWDFTEIWAIQEYETYPYLRWQSQPGDHNIVSGIQGSFAEGAGTPTNPWQISTREQLDSLRRYLGPEHSDKYFMIINDIDLYNYPATGPGWLPIGSEANPFYGHLDGNGHSLSSLNLNRSTLYNVGLFGYINQGAISNLTLSNPFVYGDYNVGGLAGYVNNGTINNCHVLDGSVTGNVSSYGDNIGAIAGEITNQTTITNSSATTAVSGRGYVGGLAGRSYSNSSISYSNYSGNVSGASYYYVGGIVGYNYYSSILECNATGTVTSQGNYVGGLVGFNHTSSITSSYSSSSVVGIDDVGGLIGESEGTSSESSLISNCYASGSVQGNARVGGLIGYNYQTSSLSDCSATGNVSGNSSVGGLIGQQGSPNYSQTISNCYSLGTVTATGNNYVGGFMGYFAGGNITNSYTLSQVNAPNTNYVGGFVGYANAGTISSCFATGQVEGNISVGGFMGTRYLATISNSYSTGNVTGNQYAGGFMGSVEAGQTQSVVNCYSVGHVKCDNYAGGFAGSVNSGELVYCFYNFETAGKSDNDGRGEPRGLGEMLQSNTFTYWEWDFATVWTIIEGTTYPFLQWQVEPSVFNYPPVTPTVSTLSISEITSNSATLMGRVDDDGGAYILSRGVVWSTSENPSLDDYLGVSYCGDGGGDYSCEIIDLNSSTTYYARAFATSVAGTAYGEPHSFTTASSWINRDFMFAAGYTWFSFNLSDVAVQPNTIFSGYTFINNDRIIGQTQYSIFDEGVWVGSLPSISGNQMYKLNLYQPLNFNLGGQPSTIVPIELNAGYTWLGYLPQECLTINDALANSSFQNQLTGDERIIGQNGFAVYDFSQGIWTGDLTQMCPGEGYIIKLKEYNVLTYPNYGKEVPGKEIESNFSASGISVSQNKQHTMMLIATLQVNDKEIVIDEGDMLFAFAGEECRGAVAVMRDKLIFMSIGSDGNLPVEQINFRLWNSKTSTFFDIQEVFTFQPLKELGTLASPTQLTVGKGATDNSTIISETVSVGDPQPNPFTHFTSIPVVLAKPSMVRIGVYSPAGFLVKQTGNFSFDSGLQRVVVYKGDLKPGIYIYTVEITYDSERVVKNGRFVVD